MNGAVDSLPGKGGVVLQANQMRLNPCLIKMLQQEYELVFGSGAGA